MSPTETAHAAASAGRDVLLRWYGRDLTMRHKGPADLVSDADVEAERAIADVIRTAHPHHTILGEEELCGDPDTEHLWIIDPLDGTTNFAHRIPHFAVSVAYYHNGIAECGVVCNPVRDDWYTAERGKGAFHNGHRLSVSPAIRLDDVLIGVGFYYDRGALMEATLEAVRDVFHRQIRGIRRMGTASLDLAQVAAGQFGAFFEFQLSPWDFAAGRLLVEEAGGTVTTCTGAPLPLQQTSVLAASAPLHAAVCEITRHHLTAADTKAP